ncbi:acetylornithine deacetylase [Roseovarius salinarum]|uniref:acetylornithine deacetylase n=1 Tax=Roseovarius salinarum TaxID=1981892 RepID=UPI000C33BA21|nr:acetylornithine deacetylase [Roseovarius salinarum]
MSARTLDLLDRLVAFPTESGSGNLDLVAFAEEFLRARGAITERLPSPDGAKAGLVARLGPAERPGVVLSGHTDVVPVAGQDWTSDPFTLRRAGDRVYGRGTTDMKGFVAAMLAAADRAAARSLSEPLKLVLSYDEEVGCKGLREMLEALPALLGAPRACIVGEPTSMQVALGHKGKAAYRARFHGTGGHSAMAPMHLNALHMAADFIQGLRALQAELAETGAQDAHFAVPHSTIHAGTLAGGHALNIVPDDTRLGYEIRAVPQEAISGIASRVQAVADEIADRYRARFPEAAITIEETTRYPGLSTDAGSPVAGWAQALAGQKGTCHVDFGTEAGFFAGELGIPTVVCGPGSMDQGHKPDEFVALAQLDACDTMLTRLVDRLSEGEPGP